MGANGRIAALEVLRSRRPEGRLMAVSRTDRAGTRSSSAAATTGWSRRRTSPRPACGRSSSSGASGSAARPTRPSWRRASACRRWPTPSGGCGRRSSRDLDLQAPRAVAHRARRPGLRAAPGRPRGHALGRCRRGPPRACAPGSAARRRRVPRLRSAGPGAGRLPRRASPARRRRTSTSPGLGDALAGLKLGRAFRGLGRDDGRTIPRVLPMAVADLVAESFETDAAAGRDRLARRPLRGDGAVVGRDDARSCSSTPPGNDGGAAGETVFARGGPGALADALAAAARAAGAEIRTDAEVASITSRDGRATGVVARRRRGDRRPGGRVRRRPEADADRPRRPGRPRADPAAGGPATSGRPASVAKVNLALAGLPRFPPPATTRALLRGRIVVAPGIDAMERAFDASKYGRPSERADPRGDDPVARRSVARRRRGGRHARDERHRPVRAVPPARGRLGRRSARRSATWSSRTLEAVRARSGRTGHRRQVLTPLDLERDYGLTGGHPLHGEPGLDQFFVWRPLLGHARYRMRARRALPVRLRARIRAAASPAARPERRARDPRRPPKRRR